MAKGRLRSWTARHPHAGVGRWTNVKRHQPGELRRPPDVAVDEHAGRFPEGPRAQTRRRSKSGRKRSRRGTAGASKPLRLCDSVAKPQERSGIIYDPFKPQPGWPRAPPALKPPGRQQARSERRTNPGIWSSAGHARSESYHVNPRRGNSLRSRATSSSRSLRTAAAADIP